MEKDEIKIETYSFAKDTTHDDFNRIMQLVNENLSEPYCIYVYRFFLNNWPELCHIVRADSDSDSDGDGASGNTITASGSNIIGVIISKVEHHREKRVRGYIGMLAVDPRYRSHGIAKRLIAANIATMQRDPYNCDEIMLETECVNLAALNLYEAQFGFIRVKRLFRYYVNTHDAYRLILPLRETAAMRSVFLPELARARIPKVLY